MKKIKRLLTLFVAIAMTLCVFATAACDNSNNSTDDGEHVCQHVCPECGKCTDDVCDDPVCDDKCEGHDVIPGGHECEHVCPEDGCGKCTDEECEDPVCEDKCPGHGTETPDHECKDECPECGGCLTDCEEEECSEKCPKDHPEPAPTYTITLVVGDGTYEEDDVVTEYKTTADGLLDIDGYLPVPVANTENWHFIGWFTEATGGDEVIEDETVFLADGNIYAQYGRNNGVWTGENVETFKGALIENTNTDKGDGRLSEYWFGSGKTISVEKGEKLYLYLEGKLISHFVNGAVGVESPVSSSVKTNYVTVTVSGELTIYLKDYSTNSNPNNWVCQYLGASEVGQGSQELIEGCIPIHVTWGGSNEITFYLKDTSGNPVDATKIISYSIYTYNNELFGGWGNAAGKITSSNIVDGKVEMTSSVAGMPQGWIFIWGSGESGQTDDIMSAGNNFVSGGSYLVELVAKNSGKQIKVTEIVL